MSMVNSSILKSLFLFNDGENKGFLKLMHYSDVVESIDAKDINFIASVFKRRDNENETLMLIKELYVLCSDKTDVDVDIKEKVDALFESIGGDRVE